jgi:hypothetical protein
VPLFSKNKVDDNQHKNSSAVIKNTLRAGMTRDGRKATDGMKRPRSNAVDETNGKTEIQAENPTTLAFASLSKKIENFAADEKDQQGTWASLARQTEAAAAQSHRQDQFLDSIFSRNPDETDSDSNDEKSEIHSNSLDIPFQMMCRLLLAEIARSLNSEENAENRIDWNRQGVHFPKNKIPKGISEMREAISQEDEDPIKVANTVLKLLEDAEKREKQTRYQVFCIRKSKTSEKYRELRELFDKYDENCNISRRLARWEETQEKNNRSENHLHARRF